MSDALIKLFADVFEVDPSSLNDDTSPDNTEQWDSLAAMHLVAAMETAYEVELTTKEIMKMSSIGLARQTLQGKGVDI